MDMLEHAVERLKRESRNSKMWIFGDKKDVDGNEDILKSKVIEKVASSDIKHA